MMFSTSDLALQSVVRRQENLPETQSLPLCRSWYVRIKHPIECCLAVLLLIVTFPLFLLGALAIKLTSRGPIIYSQTRLGRNGRPYPIFKIRTMYHNCERQSGVCWSKKGDPRITPVGRFLRATHIDELPQLWNILRGDMSLVGPRPERPEFVPGLEDKLPRYRERLGVRPGLTGLAQVQLPADTDIESVRRKLAQDLLYIQTLSFWLDLRIIISTVLHVVGLKFIVSRFFFAAPASIAEPPSNQVAAEEVVAAPPSRTLCPAVANPAAQMQFESKF